MLPMVQRWDELPLISAEYTLGYNKDKAFIAHFLHGATLE
jgi:hypothetical protein